MSNTKQVKSQRIGTKCIVLVGDIFIFLYLYLCISLSRQQPISKWWVYCSNLTRGWIVNSYVLTNTRQKKVWVSFYTNPTRRDPIYVLYQWLVVSFVQGTYLWLSITTHLLTSLTNTRVFYPKEGRYIIYCWLL